MQNCFRFNAFNADVLFHSLILFLGTARTFNSYSFTLIPSLKHFKSCLRFGRWCVILMSVIAVELVI